MTYHRWFLMTEGCRYPGEVIPGLLYLGDWDSATAFERLDEIKVKRWAALVLPDNPPLLAFPSLPSSLSPYLLCLLPSSMC